MKHYLYIVSLILGGFLQGSHMAIQAAPDNINDKEAGERGLPISIDQKGDIIYMSSNKDMLDLQVEITDSFGNILQEAYISLNAQQAYPIYIGELPSEGSYYMPLRQGNNRIVTYSIFK